MDRRQKRTRKAIFIAFNELLSSKAYDKITVQEIISAADIGRTTFYAHFDTKEALLEALCKDLFLHIKDSINHLPHAHGLYQQSIYPVSVFGHLLQHLQQNENKILELLASDNNEIFLRYFSDFHLYWSVNYWGKDISSIKTVKQIQIYRMTLLSITFQVVLSKWCYGG